MKPHEVSENVPFELHTGRFMRRWIFENFMTWVWFSMVMVFLGCLSTGSFNSLVFGPPSIPYLICMLPSLPGLIFGLILGACQREALRAHMKWTADRWVTYSALGGTLGGMLMFYLSRNYPDPRFLLALLAFCIAGAQWFSLRQAVRDAWLWPLTYLAGVLGGISLIYQVGSAVQPLELLLRTGLTFLTPALISGLVIAYLFKRRAYPPDLSAYAAQRLADETNTDEKDDQRFRKETSSASASFAGKR